MNEFPDTGSIPVASTKSNIIRKRLHYHINCVKEQNRSLIKERFCFLVKSVRNKTAVLQNEDSGNALLSDLSL